MPPKTATKMQPTKFTNAGNQPRNSSNDKMNNICWFVDSNRSFRCRMDNKTTDVMQGIKGGDIFALVDNNNKMQNVCIKTDDKTINCTNNMKDMKWSPLPNDKLNLFVDDVNIKNNCGDNIKMNQNKNNFNVEYENKSKMFKCYMKI
jgi:hypothetical protein